MRVHTINILHLLETTCTRLKNFKDQYIGSKHDIIDFLQIQSVIHMTIWSSMLLLHTIHKLLPYFSTIVWSSRLSQYYHKNYHQLPLSQSPKRTLYCIQDNVSILHATISPFHFRIQSTINPLASRVRTMQLHCIFNYHDNQPMVNHPRKSLPFHQQKVSILLHSLCRTIIPNNIIVGNQPYHYYHIDSLETYCTLSM
jgi:hypothetical protein